jgi:hypothetical protein
MKPGKPRVFIASSQESEKIARAVQANLADLDVTLWSQGVFQLSISGLENLLQALSRFDFGIFVFMPEDVVVIRDQQMSAVRDNLIFELGLFLGRLGPRRSFIVTPSRLQDLHLPSDLHGITMAPFDAAHAEKNPEAALGPACSNIRRAIEALTPPALPAGSHWFAERIAEHAGIGTASPVALAVDLLPGSASIKGDVERYLAARGLSMPVEEITMKGISGTADVVAFVEQLQEMRFLLQQRGATEVHLFYAGPGATAALIGVLYHQWINVKVYQRDSKSHNPADFYEYWAPLVKT